MRQKDENKNEAIFRATIQLLNEIGFSEISMSKIAKRAQVSSSTIYVYFENKEDMLGKLYLSVKEKLSKAIFRGVNGDQPVQAEFEAIIRNYVEFALANKEECLFLEQFTNSPLIGKLCLEQSSAMFGPLIGLLERGQREGLIKPVNPVLLLSYSFLPFVQLVKEHYNGTFELNSDHLQEMIKMSWDAARV
ncbi:TetR/AcrR family transcriptional regulator [Paenibacillus thalictri]|uniref:TetR/AcrR family transcriptional regulator n=1 Tax=Paenibacillus thalictri TaxID=2527873 RepID=A0A4Q9DI57_9BACL|nr:TetR/AcrR family transcriptional regulator [Paenibacillus thalictri]TBL71258.1 TetR/AcrR family transcriptional regulator [Paenibacillus thalictri]